MVERMGKRSVTILLVAMALFVSAVATLGSAAAQTDEPQPATVEREGWYTAKTSDAFPAILTSEFPPGVVCILVPESCGEDARQVTGPISEGLTGVEVPGGPVQPVPPGALPVGLFGGETRYASVMEIALPPAPANPFVEKFELVVHEAAPGFAVESPAFREVVRAFVSQASEGSRGPGPFQRALEQVVGQEAALLDPEPTGIEACPVTQPWEPGENQEAEQLPERDCAFGTNGVRGEDGTWTFDLTFAMQAWLEGTIPNHGVYFGPVGPENLEYGDPDFSANFVLYMAGSEAEEGQEPAYRFAATEGFDEDFGPVGGTAPSQPGPAPGGGSSGFSPAPSGGPVFDDGTEAGAGDVPGPDTAAGDATEPEPQARADDITETSPSGIPGRMWLLLPLGLGCAALFARAVGSQPVPAGATRRGALSRLTGED